MKAAPVSPTLPLIIAPYDVFRFSSTFIQQTSRTSIDIGGLLPIVKEGSLASRYCRPYARADPLGTSIMSSGTNSIETPGTLSPANNRAQYPLRREWFCVLSINTLRLPSVHPVTWHIYGPYVSL